VSASDLSGVSPPVPPPLAAALESELAQLAPVRTRRPVRRLAMVVAVSLLYGAGLVVMLTIRRDLDELPVGWLIGAGLLWLLGFAVPLYLATVPRPGSMMPRWRLAGLTAVIAAIAAIGLGVMLHPLGPHSVVLGWQSVTRGYGCLLHGLETAIVPVIAGTLALRKALPVGARWIAAALGASGGSLGGLVLHLHCPVADGLHVGLIHGGSIVAAAVLAAALVPRATEVR